MANRPTKTPKDPRGGPRPNSGRKPKAITEFNRALIDRLPDALYALELHVRVMKDEDADLKLRLECATEVMNRILGKPRQAIEVQGAAKLSLEDARELIRARHRSDPV